MIRSIQPRRFFSLCTAAGITTGCWAGSDDPLQSIANNVPIYAYLKARAAVLLVRSQSTEKKRSRMPPLGSQTEGLMITIQSQKRNIRNNMCASIHLHLEMFERHKKRALLQAHTHTQPAMEIKSSSPSSSPSQYSSSKASPPHSSKPSSSTPTSPPLRHPPQPPS